MGASVNLLVPGGFLSSYHCSVPCVFLKNPERILSSDVAVVIDDHKTTPFTCSLVCGEEKPGK